MPLLAIVLAATLAPPGATLAVSPGVGHLHPFSGAGWLVETVGGWIATQTKIKLSSEEAGS